MSKYLSELGLAYLWGKIKATFASKSGDTMTGDLLWGNGRRLGKGGSATDFDFAAGKVGIRLEPANASGNDIKNCVKIRNTENGNLYNLYGDHNKPTSADIGAVSLIKNLPDGTDLNTVKTSGFYWLGTGPTNGPPSVSVNWSLMLVMGWTDTVSQTIIQYNTGKMFTRTFYSGNTWTDWDRAVTANNPGIITLGDNKDTSKILVGTNGHYIGRDPTDGALEIGAGQEAVRMRSKATGSTYAQSFLGNSQFRNITAGTSDLTAGSSALATGEIYLVYE